MMIMMIMMMMITRQRGKVVFISSKAGVSPSAGLAVHSGTKHLLEAVARALREELRGTGVCYHLSRPHDTPHISMFEVSVSVCRPGGVNTPGYAHATGVELSPGARNTLGSWIPTDPSNT